MEGDGQQTNEYTPVQAMKEVELLNGLVREGLSDKKTSEQERKTI